MGDRGYGASCYRASLGGIIGEEEGGVTWCVDDGGGSRYCCSRHLVCLIILLPSGP